MEAQEMTCEEAAETFAQAVEETGLAIESTFVPWSESRNATPRHGADKAWESLNWRCRIGHIRPVRIHGTPTGETFLRPVIECDYSQGTAHAPASKQDFACPGDKRLAIREQIERGLTVKPAPGSPSGFYVTRHRIPGPKLVDVLALLVMDSDVLNYATFEDWAETFGFDVDSRSAESTYRECLAHALALRAALGDQRLEEMREVANQL